MLYHQPIDFVNRVLILRDAKIFRESDSYTFLEDLASRMQEALFAPNVTIFTKEQEQNILYILVSGKVSIHIGDLELTQLGQGDCFGALSVTDAEPSSASVTTLEECRCLVITQDQLFDAINDDLDVKVGMIRFLSQQMRRTQTQTLGYMPRLMFDQLFSSSLSRIHQTKELLAVALLHVDRCQATAVSEKLFQEVTERVQEQMRECDVMARWSWDTFILLLPIVECQQDIAALVQELLHYLALPFEFNGRRICASAQLGIALAPEDGEDIETLLQHAVYALSVAQKQGGYDYQFYGPDIHSQGHDVLPAAVKRFATRTMQLKALPQSPTAQAIEIAHKAFQHKLITTVAAARQLLQSSRVIIYRFNPDWSGVVAVESVAPEWRSILGTAVEDCDFKQNYAHYYRQGRVRAIDDIETEDISECHLNLLRRLQVRANLVVPLLSSETLWGLMIAHECSGPRHWEQNEISLLNSIAIQLGKTIRTVTSSPSEAETKDHRPANAASSDRKIRC